MDVFVFSIAFFANNRFLLHTFTAKKFFTNYARFSCFIIFAKSLQEFRPSEHSSELHMKRVLVETDSCI